MKLKEFIEKLSQLDPELDVRIYTQAPYEEYPDWQQVIFKDECADYSNIEVQRNTLYIGG